MIKFIAFSKIVLSKLFFAFFSSLFLFLRKLLILCYAAITGLKVVFGLYYYSTPELRQSSRTSLVQTPRVNDLQGFHIDAGRFLTFQQISSMKIAVCSKTLRLTEFLCSHTVFQIPKCHFCVCLSSAQYQEPSYRHNGLLDQG